MSDLHENIEAIDYSHAEAAFDQAARELWENYALSSVKIYYDELSIDSLLSALDTIDAPRLRRNRSLAERYRQAKVGLFPATLIDSDEDFTIVPPVVVEQSKRGNLIIDGGHRAVAAQQMGGTRITAMLVNCPDAPEYAGKTIPVSDISIVPDAIPPLFVGKRTPNPLFRPGNAIVEQGSAILRERYR